MAVGMLIFCFLMCMAAVSSMEEGFFGHHQERYHEPRNIYIDLGANDGSTIVSFMTKLVQTDTGKDGSSALQGGWLGLLNGTSGRSIAPSTWDVIAVEANEQHTDKVRKRGFDLLNANQINSMVFYNGTAIACKDGFIDFIWDSKWGGFAGATTMTESKSAVGKKVHVPSVDIVTLFRKERVHVGDFVVLKIDVEGAEYDIVRRILLTGTWRLIDKLAVEWHHAAEFVFGAPDPKDRDYKQRMDTHSKYKAQYETLVWMIEGLGEHGPQLFTWGR